MTKKKVLVLYHHRFSYPMRKSFEEYLYSFTLLPDSEVYFVNTAFGIPNYLNKISFQLIILSPLLVAHFRWRDIPHTQSQLLQKGLQNLSGLKVAFPQDEFFNTKEMDLLFDALGISVVFSCAQESEWKKIYPRLFQKGCRFHQVLTGYLDPHSLYTIAQLSKESTKSVDIGYRAWKGAYWAGKHATLKGELGTVFQKASPEKGLLADISTDDRDTLLGNDWYRFLLRCRAVVGVEGGSSILDEEGKIKKAVEEYVQQHPNASFAETERHCFPGKEGSLSLFALSPRHLEACATKTCQVLVEGAYSGVLSPEKHYIELKKDFRNLEEVLDKLQKPQLCQQIAEQAYKDIVATERYTYKGFIEEVMTVIGELIPPAKKEKDASQRSRLQMRESICWKWIPLEGFVYQKTKKALFRLAKPEWIEFLKEKRKQISK